MPPIQRATFLIAGKEGSTSARQRQFVLRDETALSGPVNMAIDRTLLERAERSPDPVTWVRLYRWSEPTVSLGRNQTTDDVNSPYCRRNQIPIVHRPTGGRAVLHADELTYAVVSNDNSLFPLASAGDTYQLIARVLQGALADLGIQTELSRRLRPPNGGEKGPSDSSRFHPPCFVSAARYELMCNGRKIAGSAQRRLRRSFLQHGSIPLQIDFERMAGALGASVRELEANVTSVGVCATRSIDFHLVARILSENFKDFLQRGTIDGSWSKAPERNAPS